MPHNALGALPVSISASPQSPHEGSTFATCVVVEGTETEWLNSLCKDTFVVFYGPEVCRQGME